MAESVTSCVDVCCHVGDRGRRHGVRVGSNESVGHGSVYPLHGLYVGIHQPILEGVEGSDRQGEVTVFGCVGGGRRNKEGELWNFLLNVDIKGMVIRA